MLNAACGMDTQEDACHASRYEASVVPSHRLQDCGGDEVRAGVREQSPRVYWAQWY